jgi:hypothetical protein
MAALAITGFFAEGRVALLSDIHRVFAWFERQDRRSGKACAIICLECPLSNYPWSLEIGQLPIGRIVDCPVSELAGPLDLISCRFCSGGHRLQHHNGCDRGEDRHQRQFGSHIPLPAAIAAAAGIPISTHLYPEMAAHVMRVSETAHWLEWQDWANPILQQPYEVKAGKLHIPDVPGVGLEWDEKAIDAHLADSF